MTESLWQLLALSASLLVIVAGAIAVWQRWQAAMPEEKRQMIMDAIRQLVDDAETEFPDAGNGPRKFGWVMTRIRQAFPGLHYGDLEKMIETVVAGVQERKEARKFLRENTFGRN
jgi:hypothetical protein